MLEFLCYWAEEVKGIEMQVQQITFTLQTHIQWLVRRGQALKEKMHIKSQRNENSPLLLFILLLIKSMGVEALVGELD
jgi:hypothetical protein